MTCRREITGRKPRTTAYHAKRRKVPRTDSPIVEPDPYAIEAMTRSGPSSNDWMTAPPIRGPPPPAIYSIKTFCLAHLISEAFYYDLQNKGQGPRETRIGSRVFITFESAAIWRAEREAATTAAGEAAE